MPATIEMTPRGVLLAGKWSTEAQLDGQTDDDLRNSMITVLGSNSCERIDILQGWDDETLVGKLAVLAILLETKWADLAWCRTAMTDDHRNVIITRLGPRLDRGLDLQGESNQALALLALPWYGKYADWMKNCAGKMQHIPLCQLPLPGSHDAGSYGAINTRSRTQQKSITGQLNAGVRFFDFRVIVDDQTYFSHHGLDHSRDNTYTGSDLHVGVRTLFKEISEFCEYHDNEIVILCFNDFWRYKGWGQVDGYFTPEDAKTFMGLIRRDFGSLLIPAKSSIPTYGACIAAKQRVLVIFDSEWKDDMIWQKKNCFRERFSDQYQFSANYSWETLTDLSIRDQQDYLAAPPQPEPNDARRDLDYVWVSQVVLNYGTTTRHGNSQNYEGADYLNRPFTHAYGHWWAGESAIPRKIQRVQRPNILLMDGSGVFDDFAADCESLIRKGAGGR